MPILTVNNHTSIAYQKSMWISHKCCYYHYFDFKWEMQKICENKMLFLLSALILLNIGVLSRNLLRTPVFVSPSPFPLLQTDFSRTPFSSEN